MPAPIRIVSGGFISLPSQTDTPKWKIEIIDDSSATHTFNSSNSDLLNATVNLSVTESVDNFNLTLQNPTGKYSEKFTTNNDITIYADYDSATHKIFYGQVERFMYRLDSVTGHTLDLSGLSFGSILLLEDFYFFSLNL